MNTQEQIEFLRDRAQNTGGYVTVTAFALSDVADNLSRLSKQLEDEKANWQTSERCYQAMLKSILAFCDNGDLAGVREIAETFSK